ncbi:MAG: hypothetical protein K0U15_02370 [Proteobacteria bacterium]|nr:hypothetical protein [Pseudomonadota bacterium]
MSKATKLLELAKLRKSKKYNGYKSIGDYAKGAYECNYVSPYSKSAHDVDTKVLLFLQDWASGEGLKKTEHKREKISKCGYDEDRRTNKNLKRLLSNHLGLELKSTYTTNLFPYIKKGPMNARIPPKDMQKAAKEFSLPMIKIIKPKIVIALGRETFNALWKSAKLEKEGKLKKLEKNIFEYEEVRIFYQVHPAQQSQNRRGAANVANDWSKMKKHLNKKIS